MSDVDCSSIGPETTRCQKILGHRGDHGGMDKRGNWRHW